MTFKEAMIEAMTSRGMFDSQAEDVMASYIENNKDDSMANRWNEDINHYPDGMVSTIWIGIKEHAYQWIEDNASEAWFRPMFQYSASELTQMMNQKNEHIKEGLQ